MNRILLALACSLSMVGLSLAKIIESDTVLEIKNYLTADYEHTLVIFDIDNTLAAPKLEIGSDQWVDHLVREKMKQGLDMQQAFNAVLPTYFHVQFKIAMHPVEDLTPLFIKEMQTQGVSVIAITARSIYVASRTLDQLDDINVKLGVQGYTNELHLNMPIPCIYMHGVIFSGNNDKGLVLIELLKNIDYLPTKIIFIDDKLKNLTAVEYAAQKCGIEFIGIRYTRCDERVANFNPVKAQEQFEMLQQITG
ncbi:MAG: DUF2608 domain-containing protein [Candidatus Babeliales bacterium]